VSVVLACSALKHAYQDYLGGDLSCVHFVHLVGSEELIAGRLAERRGHFMSPALLHSQFETLEPPEHAIEVDIADTPSAIAAEIRRRLGI
jgi:gluconokinase